MSEPIEKHFAHLRNATPDTWEHYPVCPMMSVDGKTPAVVSSTVADKPIVYVGVNIVLSYLLFKGKPWAEALEGHEIRRYDSLDALLAEWRVD